MVKLLSLVALTATTVAVCYHYLLAIGSLLHRGPSVQVQRRAQRRFLLVVAAHDEEPVIAATVRSLRDLDYAPGLVEIHVVADHCSDATAQRAREEGAAVHERREGPRTGKGAALAWLFARLPLDRFDAVVVFDADTHPHPGFLAAVSGRLDRGERVVQGQHVIRNERSGWLRALVSAMFIIDNRFQNQGRSNIGWSAKNMGDSICICADVLKEVGWGEGLTEDYDLRQRLLLCGIRICYAREAKGFGEAPMTVSAARAQRLRWLKGVRDSSKQHVRRLLVEGVRRRDTAMLDAWLQAHVPSYSTLALVTVVAVLLHAALFGLWRSSVPISLLYAWVSLLAALAFYPVLGLVLDQAPASAYRALLYGPLFIVWRVWLAATARAVHSPITWIRTPHGE